jgi:large subunit ribosomal protein L10
VPVTRKEKEAMVDNIARDLQEANLIVVTGFRGLNVSAINNLRRRLRAEQCRYKVSKNTLTRLACRRVGMEVLEEFLEGPTAIAYSNDDPVKAARALAEFMKENEALMVKGGVLSGQLLKPEDVKALGEIPPKEVLLAMLCRGLQAPISGLVNVLQGNLRNLAYVLDAICRQKESA